MILLGIVRKTDTDTEIMSGLGCQTKKFFQNLIRYSIHEFNTTIKSKGDPTYWRSIDGDVVHLPEDIGR